MKKLNEKILYEGQWLSMHEIVYQSSRNKHLTWETIRRKRSTGGVVVVARLVPSRRFIFIKQYRPAIEGYIIAFPAGLGFNDPDHALVELKEETGYTGRIVGVSPVLKSGASVMDDSVRIVSVEVDENDPANQNPLQELEDAEDIQVYLVHGHEAKNFLLDQIKKGVHVSANLWYLFNFN